MNTLTSITLACALATAMLSTTLFQGDPGNQASQATPAKKDEPVKLGNFSVSLAVKDIKASKAFYEKLDFKQVAGDLAQNWVVLQNDTTTVGLFQGMFERNMLTFNPGWNHKKETLKDFQDVRELQRTLKERGLELQTEADPASTGPASLVLVDPDGNPILIDQHVPRPKR
jgi:catechol 2,3-dioxygenase-like lactoylglutathione lyase family enzyme